MGRSTETRQGVSSRMSLTDRLVRKTPPWSSSCRPPSSEYLHPEPRSRHVNHPIICPPMAFHARRALVGGREPILVGLLRMVLRAWVLSWILLVQCLYPRALPNRQVGPGPAEGAGTRRSRLTKGPVPMMAPKWGLILVSISRASVALPLQKLPSATRARHAMLYHTTTKTFERLINQCMSFLNPSNQERPHHSVRSCRGCTI